MIVGKLKDLANYKGMYQRLDTAIDYILLGSWREAALGKTKIDHDFVFMNRFDYKCQKAEMLDFEAHRDYIDIHLMVEGNEYLCCSDIANLHRKTDYDAEADCTIFTGECDCRIKMDEDHFAICFPEEAHVTKIKYEADDVKKAVIKVRAKVE